MNQLKLEFLDIFSHCQHRLLYQLRDIFRAAFLGNVAKDAAPCSTVILKFAKNVSEFFGCLAKYTAKI